MRVISDGPAQACRCDPPVTTSSARSAPERALLNVCLDELLPVRWAPGQAHRNCGRGSQTGAWTRCCTGTLRQSCGVRGGGVDSQTPPRLEGTEGVSCRRLLGHANTFTERFSRPIGAHDRVQARDDEARY